MPTGIRFALMQMPTMPMRMTGGFVMHSAEHLPKGDHLP